MRMNCLTAETPLLLDLVDREINALAPNAKVYAGFNGTEQDETGRNETELASNRT